MKLPYESVCLLVGWSVGHNLLKGREVSRPCPYRSSCCHLDYSIVETILSYAGKGEIINNNIVSVELNYESPKLGTQLSRVASPNPESRLSPTASPNPGARFCPVVSPKLGTRQSPAASPNLITRLSETASPEPENLIVAVASPEPEHRVAAVLSPEPESRLEAVSSIPVGLSSSSQSPVSQHRQQPSSFQTGPTDPVASPDSAGTEQT